MSTKFLSPGWRMPRNANQSKQSNYSMDFDGSSQYIDLNTSLNGMSSISYSCWIKPEQPSGNYGYIITAGDYSTTDRMLSLGVSSGSYPTGPAARELFVYGGEGSGGGVVGKLGYFVTYGTWYHIAIVYTNNQDVDLYVNGNAEGSIQYNDTSSISAGSPTRIGVYSGTLSNYFNGKINEVAIFDYALSQNQVTTLWGGGTSVSNPMALPSPPIAYYPLGTSAWNGQYLVENNAIRDYVFDFDGNDDYIISEPIDVTGSTTLSIWFKTSNINTNQGLFEMMPDPNTSDYLIVWVYNGKIEVDAANSGSSAKASSVLSSNTWYNLVTTKTTGVIDNIYINGVNDTQTGAGLGFVGGRNNLYIGATYQGTAYANEFAGLISNAQIFNTALSATEVSTLYNYGSPIRTLANIPQNSNLKAWYKLDASEIYNSVSTEWEVSDATAAIKNTILDPANSNPRPYFEENTPGNLLSLTGTAGQSITISLWYYASGNADNILFNKVENGAYWFGKQSTNNLRFLFTNSSLWTLGPSVPRNQWNHIVLTVVEGGTGVGRTVKFYVNGGSPTTVTDSSSSLIDLTSQKNTFGASSYSSTNVDVLSSNYIYYNTALSDSEVVSLYNSFSPDSENTPTVQPALSSFPRNSNITGWFKSDGLDSSGQGNNGSAEGSILLGPAVSLTNGKSSGMSQANLVQSDLQTVAPYSKYALEFDGTNDYIQTTFNPYTSIGDNTSWTVSSWVYVSNVTTQQKILGIYDTTRAARFWFGIVNGGILFGYGNRGVYPISGTSVSANSWQNIIVTYSTTTGYISVYINGSINGTYDYAGNSGNGIIANANITIGDAIGESTFVNGYISNISIWNAELTSAQVREIYNEGLPSNLNSHSAYSNLVAWWQLGSNSSWTGNRWIVADEKGTNNGYSQNMAPYMPESGLTNGVGTTANGVSNLMSEGNLVGDAPYSTANAISSGMSVESRVTGSGNTP